MGKKHDSWSFETYVRYCREGRGQGEGIDYLPWLTVHTVPSNGITYRIMGRTIPRMYHLLSNHEYRFFLLLDHDINVIDIREQFPLRLQNTMQIAEQLGIKHPVVNGFPYVMTCDFLITTRNGMYARTVKMSKDLEKPRVLEKFNIEAAYWHKQGINWKIVTEKEININKVTNLEWLYSGSPAEKLIKDSTTLEYAKETFLHLYNQSEIPFHSCIESVESSFGFEPGTGINLFKSLVLEQHIHLNMDRKINLADPRKAVI